MNNAFVITGPPGSGKTPIITELVAMGLTGVAEPAREVLAEQRAAGGRGVYDKDGRLFCELMLDRALVDFERFRDCTVPVFFDRGIPDLVAYAWGFGLEATTFARAAAEHRYNDLVFFTPSWPEIYTTDEERKATFEMAHGFGEQIRRVYRELGYTIVEVPRDTPDRRARFVVDSLPP